MLQAPVTHLSMLTHVTHVGRGPTWRMLLQGCCCAGPDAAMTLGPGHCGTVNFAPGASVRIFAVVIILMSHKACIYVSSCKMKTPIYFYLRNYFSTFYKDEEVEFTTQSFNVWWLSTPLYVRHGPSQVTIRTRNKCSLLQCIKHSAKHADQILLST